MANSIKGKRFAAGTAILVAGLALLVSATGTTQSVRPATRLDAIPAILDAFRTHQLVGFPGGHTDGNETMALARALIRDPRFPTVVNDIVVEFGSSRYQDLMDRYVRGEDVPDTALRQVWLNAVQAGTSIDNPNTALFFQTVREVNAGLAPAQRLRVLLGDPPIDWDNVRDKNDLRKWVVQRDTYPADLVRREVLTRKRRALIVYANGHLLRAQMVANYDTSDWQAQTIVHLLERPGGAPMFVIRADGDLSKWQPETASWPAMSLTIVKGTVIGAVDFSEFDEAPTRYRIRGIDDFVPIPREQWAKRRLEDQVDAILYVGGRGTTAPLSRTLCDDPNYVKMRLARIALAELPPREAEVVKSLCRVG